MRILKSLLKEVGKFILLLIAVGFIDITYNLTSGERLIILYLFYRDTIAAERVNYNE